MLSKQLPGAFRKHALLRALTVLLFASFVAACQTSGLKTGALVTSFPPAGWTTKTTGTTTAYVCPPQRCRSPQVVSVKPIRIRGDLESAIRRNVITSELLDSVTKVVEVASKRAIDFTPPRRITTRNYTGFDYLITLRARNGKRLYIAVRDVVQRDRGVTIASAALNRGVARQNLRRYLAQTQIRRVN